MLAPVLHISGGPIPACAGETRYPGAYSLLRRAYPRMRGGNARRHQRASSRPGLSPHARGKPHETLGCGPDAGPIPACAGETRSEWGSQPHQRAYPRMRGGNFFSASWRSRSAGLSPHARGKLKTLVTGSCTMGPIPACAGETSDGDACQESPRAYPRMRGGNPANPLLCSTAGGLSPHARGKRGAVMRHKLHDGPIPACAGETLSSGAYLPHARAYPRMRGGNLLIMGLTR